MSHIFFLSFTGLPVQWQGAQLWEERAVHQEESQRPCGGPRMAVQTGWDTQTETPIVTYIQSHQD